MDDERLFERFTKLAELSAKRFDTRREFEWKIVLGFWAAMLAAFYKIDAFPRIPWVWLLPVMGAVVLGFILFWIWGVWRANKNDKNRYEYYFAKAEEQGAETFRPNGKREPLTCCESLGFLCDWNSQFQMLVTAALALLFVYGNAGHDSSPVKGPADQAVQAATE